MAHGARGKKKDAVERTGRNSDSEASDAEVPPTLTNVSSCQG